MEPAIDKAVVEDQIRSEFQEAFEALRQAPEEERPRAASRLNRAVRRLYDLIGYGKVPSARQPLHADK